MTRILVLGGYGLIGGEVVRALAAAGFSPVGFGRSPERGRRLFPGVDWIGGDMARMTAPEAWMPALSGIDAVVNCAGALQDGLRDNLEAVHHHAVAALVEACERHGVKRFVQVSAPGAVSDARLDFLSTKAAGDAALRASGLDWTILKPGLVMAPGAYGGTALLRTLAAFPLVQPVVLADAKVQTVAVADVAEAVRAVLAGEVASRRDYHLVEDEAHMLAGVLAAVRRWTGRDDARALWRLPRWFGYGAARLADMAGWLGWRSPLRTTALRALDMGVTGDPAPWREAGGRKLLSLNETLAALPATMQERVYGRAQLVFPLLVVTLAAFWIASGVIGVVSREAAMVVLGDAVSSDMALWLVLGGALADVLIGLGLLVRKWTRRAAWASVGLAGAYLAAGTWLTPHLWLDPMGPFVKVFPAMALAVAVAALAEER